MTKRYSYIVSLRDNLNAVAPDSSYRVGSGQVRAETMDEAFKAACKEQNVVKERNPRWPMRVTFDYYKEGQRVSVYVSPVADDQS